METANATRKPKRRLSSKTQELEKRLKYLPFIRRASEVDSDEATLTKTEQKLEVPDDAFHGDRDASFASSSIPFDFEIVYESAPLPDLAMRRLLFWDMGGSHRTQHKRKRIPCRQHEADRHSDVKAYAVDSGKIQTSRRHEEAAPGDDPVLKDSDIMDATVRSIHGNQSIPL